jgi:uroporphyrin-III C-methyltransferase
MKNPKLTLVGAGPGDPDLITIKGMKALQSADVVLYDALANEALLEYVPTDAQKIFVGKRANKHTFTQLEINELCVKYALENGHVVRLKGGDSFVFGRGHEELTYANEKGIETAVVPGISSAIAVPASVGIPVTRRGLSDSFWVLTGTTSDGNISQDLRFAVKTDATIVILMGMNNLHNIVSCYKAEQKYGLPVAIIQNGTLPNEKSVFGTIETIESLVKEHNIKAPAIIVIGKVAAESFNQNDFLPHNRVGEELDFKVETAEPKNQLFPIFMKMHQLQLLIVGGGYVGLEKVTAVLENSPHADITLVSPEIRGEIVEMSKQYPNLKLIYKIFEINDLEEKDLIIVATNDKPLNQQIKGWARERRIITNVADTPDFCDFYLGSVVKKGSLKLAISTNGKSPTLAKRIREVLEDAFPDELEDVFDNMRAIRQTLTGDFTEKVHRLNAITSVLKKEKHSHCGNNHCPYK